VVYSLAAAWIVVAAILSSFITLLLVRLLFS